MYSFKHTVGFAECGENGTLRLANALSLMVNCCQHQENSDERLRTYLRENNLAIFLHSIQIDIERMPSYQEDINVCVKIYDIKSILGFRRITITDKEGKLCAIANAIGAFYDTAEKKTVKIDPEKFKDFLDQAEEMETLQGKIRLPPSSTPLPGYVVRKSDIDPNGHMQSARYLAISEDLLPSSFKYDRVRIEFKQQSFHGDTLSCALGAGTKSSCVIEIFGRNSKHSAIAEFSLRS